MAPHLAPHYLLLANGTWDKSSVVLLLVVLSSFACTFLVALVLRKSIPSDLAFAIGAHNSGPVVLFPVKPNTHLVECPCNFPYRVNCPCFFPHCPIHCPCEIPDRDQLR